MRISARAHRDTPYARRSGSKDAPPEEMVRRLFQWSSRLSPRETRAAHRSTPAHPVARSVCCTKSIVCTRVDARGTGRSVVAGSARLVTAKPPCGNARVLYTEKRARSPCDPSHVPSSCRLNSDSAQSSISLSPCASQNPRTAAIGCGKPK